jgi:hypothetical protein
MFVVALLLASLALMDSPKLLDPSVCNSACKSCFSPDNNRHCYECNLNYIWSEGACKPFSLRDISGASRPCISCGIYNYPTPDYSCAACPFPCETCSGSDNCMTCKTELGFELNNATNMCECLKGYFKDGMCHCQNDSYYVNEEGECVACQVGTRGKGNCNPPCERHFFEFTINDCEPCHYSCDNCTDSAEESCIPIENAKNPCRTENGFELVKPSNLCICVCDSHELDGVCVCNEGYKAVITDSILTCIVESN